MKKTKNYIMIFERLEHLRRELIIPALYVSNPKRYINEKIRAKKDKQRYLKALEAGEYKKIFISNLSLDKKRKGENLNIESLSKCPECKRINWKEHDRVRNETYCRWCGILFSTYILDKCLVHLNIKDSRNRVKERTKLKNQKFKDAYKKTGMNWLFKNLEK